MQDRTALTDGEQALLRAKILQRPGPQDGCREWTLPALCRWIAVRFNKRLHRASLSRIVRALDLSRQKTRPMHPRADPKAQAAFVKGGLAQALAQAAQAHPDRKIALWFMDEARVGQKGRTGFRWWVRGERPRGLCDRRFEWAYLYGAVRPATGEDFALVLPAVSIMAMGTFLAAFAATIPADTHVVMVLDQAGWHGAKSPSGNGLSGRSLRDSERLLKPFLEPRCGPRPLGGGIAATGCVMNPI